MSEASAATTFLFSDIEGSTRLWEQMPERMHPALARHDAIARAAVQQHHGHVVKSTGDGIHAAFENPGDALRAAVHMQLALAEPGATGDLTLSVRCGLHAGTHQRRDNDFYGSEVNRAARVMSVAHGGQTLLSRSVADRVKDDLPTGVALRDLGRVRLRDLTSPEQVYQLLHPRLRDTFPPLRSLEATPNNLAQQLNSFVGRERETAEVKALLSSNRLVTLLGMGGIGKSRLSVQLGAEVMDDYPDGVWLVELAPLSDPQLVAQAVASVLGVKEEAGRPVVEALAKSTRDRRLLIILDNCEHVVHACAELAKLLLQAGSALKILASSRDPLQIAGETAYHVPTLSTPAPKRQFTLSELTRHEAVRLFIDRATASQPAFGVTEANAAAVAEICHRLDGIPLAIELAAARTRALSVETIAARLNDRFRLLVTGDRTVLPRQRTLRALIDWSYDLLEPPERLLFQRLSVFAGGWTLDAAEAVGAGGDVDHVDVLELLARLVEKSLVVMEVSAERYRMLDTVRQYAQEKMAKSADVEATCGRHLRYYLEFAEAARPELAGPDQGKWLARLDLERENALSAHAWCESLSDGGSLGLRLIDGLRPYLINRGLLSLGLKLTLEVLRRPDMDRRGEDRCRALFGAGQYCNYVGAYAESMGYLTESLAIARNTNNVRWTAGVLQLLGWATQALHDYDSAEVYLVEALDLMRGMGTKRDVIGAANQLAQLHREREHLDVAEPLYKTVLQLARELGDPHSIAVGLLNLAMVAIGRGNVNPSEMLVEVLDIVEGIKPTQIALSAMDVCAGAAASRRDWATAATYFGFVEAQGASSGLRRDPADDAFLAPRIAQARAYLGGKDFGHFAAQGASLSADAALMSARAWLGEARWTSDSGACGSPTS